MRALLRGEVAIRRVELERLRRKEASHDRYLSAMEQVARLSEPMRSEADAGSVYATGWLRCLRLLCLTTIEHDASTVMRSAHWWTAERSGPYLVRTLRLAVTPTRQRTEYRPTKTSSQRR